MGESSNSLYSLSHREVEKIMLDLGVPYNSWSKQKKGKKLLYTLFDGFTQYSFTTQKSIIGNPSNFTLEYVESEEVVDKWKKAIINYVDGEGQSFVQEYSYLPNVNKRLNEISISENINYTDILLGRLDHLFRLLIISKLCNDPLFQKNSIWWKGIHPSNYTLTGSKPSS